jgi:hypothetical protein
METRFFGIQHQYEKMSWPKQQAQDPYKVDLQLPTENMPTSKSKP